MNLDARGEFGAALAMQRGYLVRFARTKIDDADLVDELVQDTLLAGLAGENAFDGRSTLRTWLTSILRYKIIDAYRRRSVERERFRLIDAETEASIDEVETSANDFDWNATHAQDPCAQLEQRQLSTQVLQAVDALPPRQRDAFVLVHMHGVSCDEAAARVGVSNANLWVILCRTRRALRAQLQQAYQFA